MDLNRNQKNRLLTSFEYIDQLIADAEQILSPARRGCLFPEFPLDVTPAGLEEFERGTTEFRMSIQKVLQRLGLQPRSPYISALKGALTNLILVDIALEELKSRYMRGYGELTREAAEALDDEVSQMQNAIARIRERLALHFT